MLNQPKLSSNGFCITLGDRVIATLSSEVRLIMADNGGAFDSPEGEFYGHLFASAPQLLESLNELLEICVGKCGPTDDLILPNGKTNQQALADAKELVDQLLPLSIFTLEVPPPDDQP